MQADFYEIDMRVWVCDRPARLTKDRIFRIVIRAGLAITIFNTALPGLSIKGWSAAKPRPRPPRLKNELSLSPCLRP
jgi:hypothetical protein